MEVLMGTLIGFSLASVLIVGYSFCLILSLLVDEATVAMAWDVAGVTNGSITASVLLSEGLILQANGFGILSCCSLGAILAVLVSGSLRSSGVSWCCITGGAGHGEGP
eukprot:Skav201097  [mRNA]  locus=scaffold2562:422365:428153:+ [translate_table: standard]